MRPVHQALSAIVLSLAAVTAYAMATAPATPADAKALGEKAAAHVAKVGFEQAIKDFTQDQQTWGLATRDRMTYVYSYDYEGKMLAHAVNGAAVGKNLLTVKDPDGQRPVQMGIDKAKAGGGPMEFRWASPATKKIAKGASFVIPIPGKNAYIAGHSVLE